MRTTFPTSFTKVCARPSPCLWEGPGNEYEHHTTLTYEDRKTLAREQVEVRVWLAWEQGEVQVWLAWERGEVQVWGCEVVELEQEQEGGRGWYHDHLVLHSMVVDGEFA